METETLVPDAASPPSLIDTSHTGNLQSHNTEDTHTQSPDELEEDNRPLYFEGDHLALKECPEYWRALRFINKYEEGKRECLKNIDKLEEIRQWAKAHPLEFVEKLRRGEDVDFPKRPVVPKFPNIDFAKYMKYAPISFTQETRSTKRTCVRKRSTCIKEEPDMPENSLAEEDWVETNSHTEEPGPSKRVRGRVPIKVEAVTKSFNQPWTDEEQRKLEELLYKYPSEAVEMRRWEKIAKEIGNRTALQVQSRIQKYFAKLSDLGLPIPGRVPHVATRRARVHRHQQNNHFYRRPSTFLTNHVPRVHMSDDEEDEDYTMGYDGSYRDSYGDSYGGGRQRLMREMEEEESYRNNNRHHQMDDDDVSDEESIPLEKRNGIGYQRLLVIKRALKRKRQERLQKTHVGYYCDRCGCDPIVGSRYHCRECGVDDDSVDLCDKCNDLEFTSETHKPDHHLEEIKLVASTQQQHRNEGQNFTDPGYAAENYGGSFSYLDPNFIPGKK